MSYHRPKRDDAKSILKKVISIHIDSKNESVESLQSKCNDKSIELLKSIELNDEEEMEVVFWATDIPEIIGTATFRKSSKGKVFYNIDYTASTL